MPLQICTLIWQPGSFSCQGCHLGLQPGEVIGVLSCLFCLFQPMYWFRCALVFDCFDCCHRGLHVPLHSGGLIFQVSSNFPDSSIKLWHRYLFLLWAPTRLRLLSSRLLSELALHSYWPINLFIEFFISFWIFDFGCFSPQCARLAVKCFLMF